MQKRLMQIVDQETPFHTRDDLHCMTCSAPLPSFPENGGELPFIFMVTDEGPEAHCFKCKPPVLEDADS